MLNADQEVLSNLIKWVEAGERAWLCTVVKTWGSSPRPVGSLLSCNQSGQVAGSLSGGCVEEDLLEKLKSGRLATSHPEVMIYGKTQEESDKFGLPCGGQLQIIIEPMSDKSQLKDLREVLSRITNRKCIQRTLDINTGAITVEPIERFRHLIVSGEIENNNAPRTLKQTYGPRYQLFLIGAAQVSIYLAQMAQTLDYHVIVCDPREQMIEDWPIEGVQLVQDMPDDAVEKYANDKFSAIIALTHDPRIDDMGLMQALKTDAFFIGAMGSTRTSAKRRERLKLLDLSDAEIDRLYAPVGLPIGSKTPAEIAISILAQLTELRSTVDAEMQNIESAAS